MYIRIRFVCGIFIILGHFGSNSEPPCPPGCKHGCDTNTETCYVCKDGFYGARCESSCPGNCVTCSSATHCSRCKDGFTSVYGCKHFCRRNCKACYIADPSKCTKCYQGKYSKHWSCSISRLKCVENCLECDTHTGFCKVCSEGYYKRYCSKRCTDSCLSVSGKETCDIDTGACKHGCSNNSTYGNFCEKSCSRSCINANCDWKTGACTKGCTKNYFGRHCRNACSSSCFNSECQWKTGTCTKGCIAHHFGPNCLNICNVNCLTKLNETRCDQINGTCIYGCNKGYKGSHCSILISNTSLKCVDNCLDCDRHSGVCNACEDGYLNPNCSQPCTDSCLKVLGTATCYIDTGVCIHGCSNSSVYGEFCEKSCDSSCQHVECDWKTGECTKGCNAHYFGPHCNNTCSRSCINTECDWKTGECTKGCNAHYFGPHCNTTCSRSCINAECDWKNGDCTKGCITNYYGPLCNNTCNTNCLTKLNESRCDISNGTCIFGCIGGYHGTYCDKECGDECVKSISEEDHLEKRVLIGIFTGLSLLAVIGTLVTVRCLFYKRHRERSQTLKTIHRSAMKDADKGNNQEYEYINIAEQQQPNIPNSENMSSACARAGFEDASDTAQHRNNSTPEDNSALESGYEELDMKQQQPNIPKSEIESNACARAEFEDASDTAQHRESSTPEDNSAPEQGYDELDTLHQDNSMPEDNSAPEQGYEELDNTQYEAIRDDNYPEYERISISDAYIKER